MNVLLNLVLAVQILSALGMIGLILVQHGKGADMGAAFGSGSAGSLFGASGSANFLSRTTAVLAVVFFVATLALAYFGNRQPASAGSVLERAVQEAPAPASQIPGSGVSAPAAPAVTASGAGQIPTQ
jgi:preprotein translocase subunit SecG